MPGRLEGYAMRRHVLALAILMAAAPCLAFEQTLDNGLRIVLIPHRANPMVASAVVVGAGVVDEPPEASGASHFLEHLLFDGTETRSQRQLYDDADRLGAYNNATTREDHTLFTLLVAKEHAEEGLAIQADMLFRSTIPAENFEKERKIVLEELARDRSDPSYDLEAAFRAMAYGGTPIARPVLGTEASLAGITRPQVLAYYKARYVPANMTLVVMGDFEVSEMLAAVKRTFGAAPAVPAPPAAAGSWPAPPKENVDVAPAEKEPTRLLAAFPFESPPWDDTTAASEILLAAASDGKDSPLVRALVSRGVKENAPSLGIEPRRAPWSTVVLDVRVDQGVDPKAVLDAFCEAIRSTRPGGEARARIDRVLARTASDAAIARDQIHYFAMLRSSSILGSPKGSLVDEAARLASLGPADWDAASARLIAGLPAIRARIAGPDLVAKRVSWTPPANVRPPAEAKRASRAGTLANGLRYVVRESSDSDVFAMHVAFVPRAAAEPAGQEGITDLLHRAMARATIVHDPAALEARLSALGARVKAVDDPSVPFDDYYTTSEFSWLRLEVPAPQWREAVALLAETVRFPSLTADALDEARRDMRERVTRRDGSPREVAAAALDTLVASGNPLTKPVYGTEASLQAITLEELKAYHAAFAVGRRAIVTVIGPVGSADVARALEADFGPLPAGAVLATTALPPLPQHASFVAAKLGKSQASLAMGIVLDVAPGDRAALTIAVAMLSDRLAFDLRETKGLAYSIGASVRRWGGRTRFDVAMGTRPENLDEAREGIVSGVRAFRESSPSEAEVERTVNVARGAALMRRMTRISLAYEAGIEAMRGLEPGDERRFVDSLREVRAEDVKRVAVAYLDPDRLAVAVVR
jgi:predicted Zn-dependent peptidase